MASSAAEIVTMKGIHRGQVGSITLGTLLLFGSSEFTDYPVASTLWNQSEPILRKVGETTKRTLPDVSDKASESVTASLRYLGWLVVGAVMIGGVTWRFVGRAIETAIQRTRRVKDIWQGNNVQTAANPTPGNVMHNVAAATVPIVPTAASTLSGATSGDDSGEDLELSRRRQSSRIIYDNNYLRPTNQAVCKRDGILKTDLLHVDCLRMSSGNVVSSKQGRVEVAVCKKHFDVYVERRTDVGCEQNDCYGRGVLVKIGDKAIRECNEQIGLRLPQENQRGPTEPVAQVSQEKKVVTVSTASPVIVAGDGMTAGKNAVASLPYEKAMPTGAKTLESSTQLERPLPTATNAQRETPIPGGSKRMTGTADGVSLIGKDSMTSGKIDAASSPHVEFADPSDAEPDTSSDVEEEQLGKIWGNHGNLRRLSVDTMSSHQSQEKMGRRRRRGSGPRHTVSTPTVEWKC